MPGSDWALVQEMLCDSSFDVLPLEGVWFTLQCLKPSLSGLYKLPPGCFFCKYLILFCTVVPFKPN